MKDQRVAFLRKAFDGLVESLDATLRISRWNEEESVPEPLQTAAKLLLDRLGVANRLAAGKYAGSPVVISATTEISSAIQRLDVAYVEFRKSLAGNDVQKDEGALALGAEIDSVKTLAARWV